MRPWVRKAFSGALVLIAASGCAAAHANGPGGTTRSGGTRSAARIPDGVVLDQLGGNLSVIDARTGRVLHELGRYRDVIDGRAVYSTRNQAVYVIQLRRDREQLIGRSTTTHAVHHYGTADSFALSPDGLHLAAVNANGTGVRIVTLATGKVSPWRPPAGELASADYLGGIAWLDDSSALVEPLPKATATILDGSTHSVPAAAPPQWFRVTRTGSGVTGEALGPPAVPDAQPVISHESGRSAVWALSRESMTTIYRLTVHGRAVRATRTAAARVTLGIAVSPDGHRLVFVERHVRHGNQYTDLDICRVGPGDSCPRHILRHNAQVSGATWVS